MLFEHISTVILYTFLIAFLAFIKCNILQFFTAFLASINCNGYNFLLHFEQVSNVIFCKSFDAF